MIMHRFIPGQSTAETILSMLRPDRQFTAEEARMLDIMPVSYTHLADAHLVHDLQCGLVGYRHVLLGAQGHGDLPVSAAVGRAGEHLRHLLP